MEEWAHAMGVCRSMWAAVFLEVPEFLVSMISMCLHAERLRCSP